MKLNSSIHYTIVINIKHVKGLVKDVDIYFKFAPPSLFSKFQNLYNVSLYAPHYVNILDKIDKAEDQHLLYPNEQTKLN